MAIVIFIETLAKNGSQQTQRLEFNQRRIQIGRGAGCDLRFESKLISLKQAAIYEADGIIYVENLDIAKPLHLNGEKKERSVLTTGDQLQWGDCLISVEKVNDGIQLRTVVQAHETLDRKSKLSRELSLFDIDRWMSQTGLLSLMAVVAVIVFFLIIPATKSKEIWNPGPLASSHKVLEAQCSTCHSGSFAALNDEKCLSCHALSKHGEMADHANAPMRCVDCHREHRNGIDFTLTDSRLCSRCHEREIVREGKAALKAVTSFAQHPEFSWRDRELTKFSFRFPHDKHLQKDLESSDGFKTLICIDCHAPQNDRLSFEKISFERQCADCHSLDFNIHGLGATLPHGNSDEAFRVLKKVNEGRAGSRLHEFSQNGDEKSKRRRPGLSASTTLPTLRALEESLMGKTLCGSCHEMQERSVFGAHQSRYDILKGEPKIQTSQPLHRSHQSMACLTCHDSVRSSQTVSEDLRPQKANCETCHRDQASGHSFGSFIPSSCSFCHGYHKSLLLDPSREGKMSR